MADTVPVIHFARVVGVNLVCDLCGDTAHLVVPPHAGLETLEEHVTQPGARWMNGHHWPRLASVEVLTQAGVETWDHVTGEA